MNYGLRNYRPNPILSPYQCSGAKIALAASYRGTGGQFQKFSLDKPLYRRVSTQIYVSVIASSSLHDRVKSKEKFKIDADAIFLLP